MSKKPLLVWTIVFDDGTVRATVHIGTAQAAMKRLGNGVASVTQSLNLSRPRSRKP
jgi:hypothetical protein